MRDKVVVVTGAFGVLGSAVAKAAAARGAQVAALGSHGPAPAALEAALGEGGLIAGGHDLSTEAGAKAAMQAVLDRFGRIDALLNIAGGFRWQTTAEGDAGTWERLYATNVLTTLHATRAALPALVAAGGRIVNVGAAGALKAGAGMGAYAASKSGVHRLTEGLAEELKGKVAVNAVLPSIIDTEANRADMPDADPSAWVTTAELAAVILFLASSEASGVTGALVPVTGRV
jgi:NAD(P)-dependent dehydrogenase (short-subunit alcohol dehydrogenase family)